MWASVGDVPVDAVLGRVFAVTGANSGVGLECVRTLHSLGAAQVFLLCRSRRRAEAAAAELELADSPCQLTAIECDVADLDSVEAAAVALEALIDRSGRSLAGLLLNAGVMVPPRSRSPQNHDITIATNHLGHFALLRRLWPVLTCGEGRGDHQSRVVFVSSNAHRHGRLDVGDWSFDRRWYGLGWQAYCDSKQANLLTMLELNARAGDSGVVVTAAHPGWTSTGLFRNTLLGVATRLIGQSAADGSLPLLRALLDPQAQSGDYFGPSQLGGLWGGAVLVDVWAPGLDRDTARALWERSEREAGRFDVK